MRGRGRGRGRGLAHPFGSHAISLVSDSVNPGELKLPTASIADPVALKLLQISQLYFKRAHCMYLYCTALHCTALHYNDLCCTAVQSALRCCTTALHFTALYFTVYGLHSPLQLGRSSPCRASCRICPQSVWKPEGGAAKGRTAAASSQMAVFRSLSTLYLFVDRLYLRLLVRCFDSCLTSMYL